MKLPTQHKTNKITISMEIELIVSDKYLKKIAYEGIYETLLNNCFKNNNRKINNADIVSITNYL